MRMIVFFDLPVETAEERKNYRKFRKFLISNGFLMLQQSVYSRLLLTSSAEKTLAESVRKNRPPKGLVELLTITEKQFGKIEFISGEFHSEVIDTDERLIIL